MKIVKLMIVLSFIANVSTSFGAAARPALPIRKITIVNETGDKAFLLVEDENRKEPSLLENGENEELIITRELLWIKKLKLAIDANKDNYFDSDSINIDELPMGKTTITFQWNDMRSKIVYKIKDAEGNEIAIMHSPETQLKKCQEELAKVKAERNALKAKYERAP